MVRRRHLLRQRIPCAGASAVAAGATGRRSQPASRVARTLAADRQPVRYRHAINAVPTSDHAMLHTRIASVRLLRLQLEFRAPSTTELPRHPTEISELSNRGVSDPKQRWGSCPRADGGVAHAP